MQSGSLPAGHQERPTHGQGTTSQDLQKHQVCLLFIAYEVGCLSATLSRLYHLLH